MTTPDQPHDAGDAAPAEPSADSAPGAHEGQHPGPHEGQHPGPHEGQHAGPHEGLHTGPHLPESVHLPEHLGRHLGEQLWALEHRFAEFVTSLEEERATGTTTWTTVAGSLVTNAKGVVTHTVTQAAKSEQYQFTFAGDTRNRAVASSILTVTRP